VKIECNIFLYLCGGFAHGDEGAKNSRVDFLTILDLPAAYFSKFDLINV
jgi:hypothetical protein